MKIVTFLLFLQCSLTVFGDIAEVKIALSSTEDPQTSGTFVWAKALSDSLQQDGWTTTIYPTSTLGGEIVRSEQIRLGLLEINIAGGQEVAGYSELYRALELPFQLDSASQLSRLLAETSLLEELNIKTLPHGLKVVDFVFLGGMGGLFTARDPVRRIEDLRPLRMRAMTSEQIQFFEAWEGPATQVAWEEVPQALQTGIADGYMNPPIVAVLFGHGPQLKYFSNLRFQPSMRTAVISARWYDSLSTDQQMSVDHALTVARSANHQWLKKMAVKEFDMLREIGIEILEVQETERDRFRDRITPLYRDWVEPSALKRLDEYLEQLK